jgi:septal ring factor EnvC (AmiA/AmiB activator)
MQKIQQSLSEFLASGYVNALRKRPLMTAAATLLTMALFSFTLYLESSVRANKDRQRRESLATYSQQLQQLDNVQQGLKNLSDFVGQQRTRLQEAEQLVSKLQEEKQRIEPLVQADRKVVEAVFQLQEQRTAATVDRERWIGFALGVGASLLASFIYTVAGFYFRRARRDRFVG